MAKKYEKYVLKHPIEYGEFGPAINMVGERDFHSDFSIIYLPVTKPVLMEKLAHKHDFDMYLTFLGFHPNGLKDLGGEIEMFMGEEQEKYIITAPTSIYIPKGLIHCPLNFKRIDKPVLLVHVTIAPKYYKTEISS